MIENLRLKKAEFLQEFRFALYVSFRVIFAQLLC